MISNFGKPMKNKSSFALIRVIIFGVMISILIAIGISGYHVATGTGETVTIDVIERQTEYNSIMEWNEYVVYTSNGERFVTSTAL